MLVVVLRLLRLFLLALDLGAHLFKSRFGYLAADSAKEGDDRRFDREPRRQRLAAFDREAYGVVPVAGFAEDLLHGFGGALPVQLHDRRETSYRDIERHGRAGFWLGGQRLFE